MNLQCGDTAVVTGAASGIGRALAEALAARGVTVVLVDLDTPELRSAHAAIPGSVAEPVDVTDAEALDAAIARVHERYGGIDLVCANAGVPGHPARLWETPRSDWRWVLEVNVWGVINLLSAALPAMVEADRGHVVVTASIAAWSAGAAMAPYAASKHALLGLSESLHRDLAGSGSAVGMSVLCPGAVATSFNERSRWPDRLGARPVARDDVVAVATTDMLTAGIHGGVDPAAAARAALDAVTEGRFLTTTDPAWIAHAARARVEIAGGAIPALRRHVPE